MKKAVSELESARTRLANAQAEKYELKNAILRQEYVKKSDVEKSFAKVVMNIKTKLLALPSALAVQLAEKAPGEIEIILCEKIYEVLREFSEGI